MKSVALGIAALIATTGLAAAHDTRPIDRTQAAQARQIEDGRYSGELTRREYRALVAEQDRIAELERKAKADGVVTGREYRQIREVQTEAGRHIYAEAHDANVSFWRRWLYRTR